ncbi:DUF4062 domain-containing protein [Nitrospira sp. Nam80]
MARPRVFLSSTHFDLKHVRSSLETFITAMGFEAVLSENGTITYSPDVPLDESCYREAQACDIFVLLLGGRYGAESSPRSEIGKEFYDRYNSITKKEYIAAREKNIPIYILIDRAVWAEYETYLRNKGNKDIKYAHVDSINTFELIEDILLQRIKNPIRQFDNHSDIESWLREQWAGLFKDLLQRMQSQEQIASLQSQVVQLSEMNITLKRYLETIIPHIIAPQESKVLIETEKKRLDQVRVERELSENQLGKILLLRGLTTEQLRNCLVDSDSAGKFRELIEAIIPGAFVDNLRGDEVLQLQLLHDINAMRQTLELPPFPLSYACFSWRLPDHDDR